MIDKVKSNIENIIQMSDAEFIKDELRNTLFEIEEYQDHNRLLTDMYSLLKAMNDYLARVDIEIIHFTNIPESDIRGRLYQAQRIIAISRLALSAGRHFQAKLKVQLKGKLTAEGNAEKANAEERCRSIKEQCVEWLTIIRSLSELLAHETQLSKVELMKMKEVDLN